MKRYKMNIVTLWWQERVKEKLAGTRHRRIPHTLHVPQPQSRRTPPILDTLPLSQMHPGIHLHRPPQVGTCPMPVPSTLYMPLSSPSTSHMCRSPLAGDTAFRLAYHMPSPSILSNLHSCARSKFLITPVHCLSCSTGPVTGVGWLWRRSGPSASKVLVRPRWLFISTSLEDKFGCGMELCVRDFVGRGAKEEGLRGRTEDTSRRTMLVAWRGC